MVSSIVSSSNEHHGGPLRQVFYPIFFVFFFEGEAESRGWFGLGSFCFLVLRVEPQTSKMLDSTLSSELHRSQYFKKAKCGWGSPAEAAGMHSPVVPTHQSARLVLPLPK